MLVFNADTNTWQLHCDQCDTIDTDFLDLDLLRAEGWSLGEREICPECTKKADANE